MSRNSYYFAIDSAKYTHKRTGRFFNQAYTSIYVKLAVIHIKDEL